MPTPAVATELYTGNPRGAIGDLVRPFVPENFLHGAGADRYSARMGRNETLEAVRGSGGTVTLTIKGSDGESLLVASGQQGRGEGLSEFKMFGSEVPHTLANQELAIGAMSYMNEGNNFRTGINELVGKDHYGGYSNGEAFVQKAKAGQLHDFRPSGLKGKGGLAGMALAGGIATYELFSGHPAEAAVTAAGIIPGGSTVAVAALGGSRQDVKDSAVTEGLGMTGALAGGAIGGPLGALAGGLALGAVPPALSAANAAIDASLASATDRVHSPQLLSPQGQADFAATLDRLPSEAHSRMSEPLQTLIRQNNAMTEATAAAETDPKNPLAAAAAHSTSEELVRTYTDLSADKGKMAEVQQELKLHESMTSAGVTPASYHAADGDKSASVVPAAIRHQPSQIVTASR